MLPMYGCAGNRRGELAKLGSRRINSEPQTHPGELDHGDKPIMQLETRHIRRIIAARAATPHAANTLLKVIKMVMRFAADDGWIDPDPAMEVRKIRTHSEGFHTWSEDETLIFESYWPVGSRARLAFAL